MINNKDFGNPSLLNNITDYFKIDEIGSNYPKPIFNPHEYVSKTVHVLRFASNIEDNYDRAVNQLPFDKTNAFAS